MKKQELIHLHGLLAEVCNHYEAVSDGEVTREKYDTLGVHPTSIHMSKTDHKEAVFALAEGITGTMRAEQQRISATAD